MKQEIKEILNKKNLIIFIIIFSFSIIIFLPWIKGHLATDTYNIIDRGYSEYAIKYSLNDGRPVMCLISLLANKLNLPINIYIINLTIIAIFISCISVMFLKKMYQKYKKPSNIVDEIILIIICYITIFNFMFLENMQFAECAVMSLSILFYIIAAFLLVQNKNKSIIFSILGILCYQRNTLCITCYDTSFYNSEKRR